uniref:Epidermal patterning factor-like protein n=1 Tax=Setaria viridis TaxID=4556 RepID=A0A4U6TGG9_SETVI|nr:hypothetical protein SEVIR_8G175400v2 [Setaria viridis]
MVHSTGYILCIQCICIYVMRIECIVPGVITYGKFNSDDENVCAYSVVVTAAGRPIRLPAAALARRRIDSSTAVTAATTRIGGTWTADAAAFPAARRRWLVGPGSSPPTCRGRCGRCAPCRPTRVAIQPGVGPQWEYYPEVWRCKCGNKLFMP